MSDRTRSWLRRAACAGLAAVALGAAAAARAEDLFDPKPPAGSGHAPAAQCPVGAQSDADLQGRIAQVQARIARQLAPGTLPGDAGMGLNGSGYNYGSGTHDIDQAALDFEAKQAR